MALWPVDLILAPHILLAKSMYISELQLHFKISNPERRYKLYQVVPKLEMATLFPIPKNHLL